MEGQGFGGSVMGPHSLVIWSGLRSGRRDNRMSSGPVLVQQHHKHAGAAGPLMLHINNPTVPLLPGLFWENFHRSPLGSD